MSAETADQSELLPVAVTPIRTVLKAAGQQAPRQAVRLQGTVTLHSPESLFLQDATGGIFAYRTTNGQVHVGDLVEVVGHVRSGQFSPILDQAVCRLLGSGPIVQAQIATGPQLKAGALDMQLVRVRGPLLAQPISQSDRQVLPVRVDETLVSLVLLEYTNSPLSQLRAGSLLQAVGVCSIEPDANQQVGAIRIYLRSGEDVVVLRGPPWWTPERTAVALGLGTAIGVAAVALITMRRHKQLGRVLEQRVQERTAELERVNRELESFSYTVSHDLRAPLRAMAGFSDALEEDCGGRLDEVGRAYLQRIRNAVAQMRRLIDGLLALAQVTRSELRREPTDLTAVASSVAEELRHGESNASVHLRIEPDMVDSADRDLVRIVFANLLQNAFKFTRKSPNPTIEVGRVSSGKPPVYFVRDNGAGFDPQKAERLFQVFQRLHSAAEYEGTGIGLATVQKIVQRHGGRVWADAQVNKGACFYFTLGKDGATGREVPSNPAPPSPPRAPG